MNRIKIIKANFPIHPVGDSVLLIAFLAMAGCKWAGVISWSWWWVTSPLWAPSALAITVVCMLGIVTILGKLLLGWDYSFYAKKKI